MSSTAAPDIIINGKLYPLWQQFVHGAAEWVGGILEDSGDSMDRAMGAQPASTRIKSIELRANGKDSAWFGVEGGDFSCGFDVGVGGIIGGDPGWLTLSGYGGHRWRIKKPEIAA